MRPEAVVRFIESKTVYVLGEDVFTGHGTFLAGRPDARVPPLANVFTSKLRAWRFSAEHRLSMNPVRLHTAEVADTVVSAGVTMILDPLDPADTRDLVTPRQLLGVLERYTREHGLIEDDEDESDEYQ